MIGIVPTEADLAIAQEIVSFVRGFGVKIGRGHVAVQLIARHAATARKEERAAIVEWFKDQLDPAEQLDCRITGLIDAIERDDQLSGDAS